MSWHHNQSGDLAHTDHEQLGIYDHVLSFGTATWRRSRNDTFRPAQRESVLWMICNHLLTDETILARSVLLAKTNQLPISISSYVLEQIR